MASTRDEQSTVITPIDDGESRIAAFRESAAGFRDRLHASLMRSTQRSPHMPSQSHELPEEYREAVEKMFKDGVVEIPHDQQRTITIPVVNPILDALDELREVLTAKQHDYAGEDPFDNFRESAALAGIEPDESMLNLVGVKLSRIRNLRRGKDPVNEPLLDSYKDHAGYAIILYAYAKQEAGRNPQ